MCGVKPLDRKNSKKLIGHKRVFDRMAKTSNMRCYDHVLKEEEKNVIVKALKFEVSGSRARGRPKQTWKKQKKMKRRKMDW